MINISIKLDEQSIRKVINRLQDIKEDLNICVADLVEVLAKDGAEQAQSAYGSMVSAYVLPVSTTEAKIEVPGGDTAIIAEFGAGYATMEYHPFAKKAPVPIEVASFSKKNFDESMYGGLFWLSDDIEPGEGFWYFNRILFDRVPARHGLLDANDYIMQNYLDIAREVIKL